jgi:hypothetical protein
MQYCEVVGHLQYDAVTFGAIVEPDDGGLVPPHVSDPAHHQKRATQRLDCAVLEV